MKYTQEVELASKAYNVEKELIYAIIKCESGFDKDAHSHAEACGLMQLTPDTFEWLKLYTHESDLDVVKLTNPEVNIKYGTLLISILREKHNDDDTILCSYNAGESVVKRWLKDRNISFDGNIVNNIPYKETRNYVKKVKAAKKIYKKLYFTE